MNNNVLKTTAIKSVMIALWAYTLLIVGSVGAQNGGRWSNIQSFRLDAR